MRPRSRYFEPGRRRTGDRGTGRTDDQLSVVGGADSRRGTDCVHGTGPGPGGRPGPGAIDPQSPLTPRKRTRSPRRQRAAGAVPTPPNHAFLKYAQAGGHREPRLHAPPNAPQAPYSIAARLGVPPKTTLFGGGKGPGLRAANAAPNKKGHGRLFPRTLRLSTLPRTPPFVVALAGHASIRYRRDFHANFNCFVTLYWRFPGTAPLLAPHQGQLIPDIDVRVHNAQ